MRRRQFIQIVATAAAAPIVAPPAVAKASPRLEPFFRSSKRVKKFEHEEATISDLQAAMKSGRETAVSLAKTYLQRIEDLDRGRTGVNSVIELNPDALAIARALDEERRKNGPRSPLHGVPVMLKDNIDTHDRMMTTSGSLALLGSIPPRDSTVAAKLRAAGAVILGKTNLSEWANFRGDRSTSGWSGRGGQTHNPYALDRNPSGSSSGSAAAVSANFCAAAIGTETDGSIVSPSSLCGVVGLKPTVGLISRAGIIPIAHSQDTAGPMARSVADAAILLGALAGVDPRDPDTERTEGRAHRDYTQFLDVDGLRGVRLGVVRRYFRGGSMTGKILEEALEQMKKQGATLVDVEEDIAKYGPAEREVLLFEFKSDLNDYLASLGEKAPVRSLKEVIEFNLRNKEKELRYFGQETMIKAQEKGPLTEHAYFEALNTCRRLSRDEGIDGVMKKHLLDALIAPSGGPAGKTDWIYGDRGVGGSSSPAAVAGYPNITVPAGEAFGLPFGISFFGGAYTEAKLLKIAYAFEQCTKARRAPRFLTSLEEG